MSTTTSSRTGTTAATNKTPASVTRKGQPDTFTTIALVTALESAWNAVRANHPDVPEAVLIIGSGTATRQAKWGHYGSLRWQHGNSRLSEVLISGEGLRRPAPEVLTTLLHEAAHGLADSRGVKDTSRQGRWHNQKFAKLADELGLDAHKDDRIGWSVCTLRGETRELYGVELKALTKALSAYRHPEIHAENGRTSSNNALACACTCPRRIRVARAVLDEGTITCEICGGPFEPTSTDA
jgi:hypothetical protein